ncbi:alcohol dehydrogenase catalytic domain-containing protein [Kitasatospora sp. RB6PN24]|uniref:zinc-dependent alcohol dehydrogenase n=1 Tax=Kitasatospora humi TaxID=2893891 RepID=UPI001E462D40|nr:FAD-dependent oxidoreductase [Kitasatospora humi]MCC9305886.1 alcohol dehydrogenase catalytic domain-containing protein [Kitasatospora humi]
MRAVVFEEVGRVGVHERAVPAFDGGDVLVRVAATGICGTDRAILLGEFPARRGVVLGHEAVGAVAAVGAGVGSVAPGDRVVINPTYHCDRCRPCRRGMQAHCGAKAGREVGVDRDGTMADYAVVPERFVHRLPAEVPYRRGALVEPLACVLNNLAAARPRWDDRVLVVGAGPIGALCALVLARRGARVTLAERDPGRSAVARQVLPEGVRVLEAGEAVAADSPDVVIDTTGTLPGDLLGAVAAGGTVVVMGEREAAVAAVPLRALVTRGIRLVGAGPYRPADFELAVDLARDLPLERLVTHVLPLERYAEALTMLAATAGAAPGGYSAMKVLLTPDEGVAP